MIVILVLLIMRHYKYYSVVLGVTLSLRDSSIPTDGSGRIVITDINPDGDNDENALICQAELSISGHGNWFLHSTQQTTQLTFDGIVRIESTDLRGWHRNRVELDDDRQLVRLRRDDSVAIGGRALEGVLTCIILGESNTPVSVGIYYPSKSHACTIVNFYNRIMHYPFITLFVQ